MKNFKIIIIFFLTVVTALNLFPIGAFAAEDPDIQAESVLLIELGSDRVYYSKNPDVERAQASLTKIMTALLAIEAYERGEVKLDDMITASNMAHYDLTVETVSMNIVPGETMSFKDLMYCMLVASANESCNIVAEYLAGDVAAFVERMNLKAEQLGCKHTNFKNPHGLTQEGHYSTAYDVSLITKEALKHELFTEIISTVNCEVQATNKSDVRYITTTNMLINPQRSYYYEYASGIKTGYTDAAGHCLVSCAEKDGIQMLCVLMGAKSVDVSDTMEQVQSFSETKRLYEWFYNSYSYRNAVDTDMLVAEVPVLLGDGADSVILRPQQNIALLLDNDFDVSTLNYDVEIYGDEENNISAPISKGQVLGEVRVTINGQKYGPVPLVANSAIGLSKLAYLKMRLSETLHSKLVKLLLWGFVLMIVLYAAYIVYHNMNRRKKKIYNSKN